eukprot:CAMPEP_0171981138 /NCGR_PEP_ID=MMETSP0993-20121228/265172_1 /TAXON_ID=483369 /ORGANISM="non described non described, Strain CCMP2098" /LENGTH=58 /DNA_ID=CAMNT_0012633537 /DNA_START=238 /DNA_END=411 /DNA_ORIENTATION=+
MEEPPTTELMMEDPVTCGQRCHKRPDITQPMFAAENRAVTDNNLDGAAISSLRIRPRD